MKTPREKGVLRYLRKRSSSEILFHHRMPTSTDNVTNACHPFSTKKFFSKDKKLSGTEYILIHNGVISNPQELKKQHDQLDIPYSSKQLDGRFNDSEALLWDIALYMEGFTSELSAKGSISFIMIAKNPDTGNLVHFGHNYGSPLKLKMDDGSIFLSSTGDGDSVDENKLHTFNPRTSGMNITDLEFNSNYGNSYYNNPHTHTAPETWSGRTDPTNSDNIPDINKQSGYYWDDVNQELWMYDKDTDKWENSDNTYSSLGDEDEEESNEAKPLYDLFENCSDVLLVSKGLRHKKGDGGRQLDIRKRLNEYLESYAENYQTIYKEVSRDLDWLREEYAAQLGNSVDNKDLIYEIRVTEGVEDLVYIQYLTSEPVASKAMPNIVRQATHAYLDSLDSPTQMDLLPSGNTDRITDSQLSEFRLLAASILNRGRKQEA